MTPAHHDKDDVLESLRMAVSKALERKRRLGQYAIVWRNGKPVRIDPDTTNTRQAPTLRHPEPRP